MSAIDFSPLVADRAADLPDALERHHGTHRASRLYMALVLRTVRRGLNRVVPETGRAPLRTRRVARRKSPNCDDCQSDGGPPDALMGML